jgi:hypothetical protein|tara:strand:+ start:172 stop:369 length:198 start_codon:yes stop_codon:yes gene_type:complete
MDTIQLAQFVQKTIRDRKTLVLEVLENNGVNSMEQYKELMGEMIALNYVLQELTSLLEKQELNDG